MKTFTLLLMPFFVIGFALAGIDNNKAHGYRSGDIPQVDGYAAMVADSIAPDTTGMRNIGSVELAQEMVPGWNVGNSLDAIGGETAWGNPLISQRLIDSVKARGFHAVRIPVAWSNFMDTTTYTISPALMTRVEQVVNYVLSDSMYAIVNIHWDGGWMQPTYASQAYVNHRLAVMWGQIAVHFRDYGDHLLFAGTNEVMVTNNYNTPTVEYYTVQNSFNQTFVTTVRSTGGRNYYRDLLVQGFNTNINFTYSYFARPRDVTPYRLMVEVHYYDPYDFTLNTSNTITQWGKNATNPAKTETWANEAYADGQFQKMKSKFIDSGYAVVLGEYGVIARLNLGSPALNAEYAGYRLYSMQYLTGSLFRHGLVPIYWDNGYTGDQSMGIFNRSTGAQAYPDIMNAIIQAVDTSSGTNGVGLLQTDPRPAQFSLAQNYPNPFNPSTNISFSIPSRSFVSVKVFDVTGREVATIASEELPPGKYSRVWNAAGFASGVYFCRMRAGSYTASRELILLK